MAEFHPHYPSVTSAKVVVDKDTGRSKCFGFVRFADPKEQKRAIVEMNGSWISTRQACAACLGSSRCVEDFNRPDISR